MKEILFQDLVQLNNIINRVDLKNKFEFVMKSFVELLGYKEKNEIIGNLTIKDLIKEINNKEKVDEILNYIQTNKEWNGFIKLKRKNPEEVVWVKLTLIPFYLNGVKNGYQFIVGEVSEKDIIEERKKEIN